MELLLPPWGDWPELYRNTDKTEATEIVIIDSQMNYRGKLDTYLDGQTIISKGRAYDCFRHNIDKYFLAPGRKIHILAETADESIIRTLLLHNKAINIGYDYADPLYPHPDIVSRTLKEEISGQMIYLVSNPQVRKTKAACLFRDYLLEWMKKKAAIGECHGQAADGTGKEFP